MKYYHVVMNILDVMVVSHLHFWSAYAMAVFLDRYIPTPRQKQDFNVGSVTFTVLAQIRVYKSEIYPASDHVSGVRVQYHGAPAATIGQSIVDTGHQNRKIQLSKLLQHDGCNRHDGELHGHPGNGVWLTEFDVEGTMFESSRHSLAPSKRSNRACASRTLAQSSAMREL